MMALKIFTRNTGVANKSNDTTTQNDDDDDVIENGPAAASVLPLTMQ